MCASIRLTSSPVAARVLGEEIVLFRDRGGIASALLDRCCHRGTPLSLGRIVDDALACAYHGWRYSASGECIHIPSLPSGRRIPEKCGVPAYLCVEQEGYIWIWMPDSTKSPVADPSAIPGFKTTRWVQGSIDYRCDALMVIENNLDWCHTPFTHEGTHPGYFIVKEHGFTEYPYEIRLTETGMLAFAPATESEGEPIPENVVVLLRFDLPSRVIVSFGVNPKVTVVIHVVPTTADTCRVEWLYTNPSHDGSALAWSDQEPEIFAQDRRVLERAQRSYEREGSDFEKSVEADASTLLA
ncbi:MAG: Rieske 2Fe-2S domain-containing protein, partial [bacterium]